MEPTPQSVYTADESVWDSIARLLDTTNEVPGVDSETVGCDPSDDTAVGTARVVAWSVAVPAGKLRPRGFRDCADQFSKAPTSWVLPPQALDHRGIRRWLEDPRKPKVAHNGRYDRHAFANEGVSLLGLVDTVDVYRVICPGRERYGLKFLVPEYLGWQMTGEFKDVFSEARVRVKTKRDKYKACPRHGRSDLYRRKKCEVCDGPLEAKEDVTVIEETLKSRRQVPLQEVCAVPVLEQRATDRLTIRPGEHPLWSTFVEYAGADAIGAAQLWQVRKYQLNGSRRAKIPTL